MLNGNFKEANQEKIALQGKTAAVMLQFLKLLYPENMIKKPLVSFSSKSIFNILALADEYQAVNVIFQCLKKTKITSNNVFQILPYATKYDQTARKKCIEVLTQSIPIKQLEPKLAKLEKGFVIKILGRQM